MRGLGLGTAIVALCALTACNEQPEIIDQTPPIIPVAFQGKWASGGTEYCDDQYSVVTITGDGIHFAEMFYTADSVISHTPNVVHLNGTTRMGDVSQNEKTDLELLDGGKLIQSGEHRWNRCP